MVRHMAHRGRAAKHEPQDGHDSDFDDRLLQKNNPQQWTDLLDVANGDPDGIRRSSPSEEDTSDNDVVAPSGGESSAQFRTMSSASPTITGLPIRRVASVCCVLLCTFGAFAVVFIAVRYSFHGARGGNEQTELDPSSPGSPCTVCADGSPVPGEYRNHFAVATPDARNLTCAQFEREVSSLRLECLEMQLFGTYNCGCVRPHPKSECNLCPNGELPPPEFRYKTLAPESATSAPLTCREMYFRAARSASSDEVCDAIQRTVGPQCGCSLEGRTSSPSASRSATTYEPSAEPRTRPSEAPSSAPTPIPNCPVCFDGPVSVPNQSALLFPFGEEDEYDGLTCQGVSLVIDDLVRNSTNPSETCLYWQLLGSLRCGCDFPHPQARCPICTDGTLPAPDVLDRLTPVEFVANPGKPMTCLDLVLNAATTTSNDCDRFTSFAAHCNCPGNAENAVEPSRLPSGTISPTMSMANTESPSSPAPSLTSPTAPSPLPTTMAPSTIAPTAVIVKQTLPPSLAPNTQAPTRPPCPLCADGAPVREEFLQEYGARTVDGDNITCQVLEAATENAETDCFTLQLLGIINCGCEHPHPRSACSLCPKGELPPADFRDAQVPVFAKPNDFRTCGDLWRQAAGTPETDPASCAILQERYATPCGCDVPLVSPTTRMPTQSPKPTPPPAPTRAPCLSFCGDGLPVPDEYVDRIAIASSSSGRSFTCGQIEEDLEDFSDDCFQLQLLGSYKCGCVQPHPDAGCNLCSGGGLPPDEFLDAETSLIGNDGNSATCQTLYLVVAEEPANSQQCVLYQSRWGASQCGCPVVEAR